MPTQKSSSSRLVAAKRKLCSETAGGFLFVTLFCTVVIALAVPPLLAREDGLLTQNSSDSWDVQIGWLRGCVTEGDCSEYVENLTNIVGNRASRNGKALFFMLLVMVSASAIVLITCAVGVLTKSWWLNRMGVGATVLAALSGVVLIFVASNFRDAATKDVQTITRNFFDIACEDGQILCKGAPNNFGCSGEYSVPQGSTISCQFLKTDMICTNSSTNQTVSGCVAAEFVRPCADPLSICKLKSGDAFRLILAQGVLWLLLGMFVFVAFINRGLTRPVQPAKKLAYESATAL